MREAIAWVEMATNTRRDKFPPAPDGDRLLALKHHVIRKRRPETEVSGEKRCVAESAEREQQSGEEAEDGVHGVMFEMLFG